MKTDELRVLAEGAECWSNVAEIHPATDDDPLEMGALEDGTFYPVVTIDAESYDQDSMPLAKFYAGANPAAVIGLLDEIDRLRTEAVAADIRIENDKLEFQRIYAVLRSHAEITQKAEAEHEAALADAKRLTTAIKAAIERLHSNPASYLTNSVADKLQMALEEQP